MSRTDLVNGILQNLGALGQDEVRQRAEALWKEAGRPEGSGEAFWFRAEEQLRTELSERIVDKVVSPYYQERTVAVQESASHFAKSAGEILQSILNDRLSETVCSENILYHRRSNNIHYFIIEESPRVRTLFVDMGYHKKGFDTYTYEDYGRKGYPEHDIQTFRIALPYVVYGIAVRAGNSGPAQFVYGFRNLPVNSVDDVIHLSHLPNSHDRSSERGFTVCSRWGQAISDPNPVKMAKSCITSFWQETFTYCLHQRFPKDKRVMDWKAWEKASEDPLFILGVDWNDTRITRKVRQFIGDVTFGNSENIGSALQSSLSLFQNELLDAMTLKNYSRSRK